MGELNGQWVEPEIRDHVVSHIKHLHEEGGMKLTVLLNHIDLNKKKYHEWVKRTGKPNHHNGKIPKQHWLTPDEV